MYEPPLTVVFQNGLLYLKYRRFHLMFGKLDPVTVRINAFRRGTYMHTYVHTYIRTYVQTYVHTYMHIPRPLPTVYTTKLKCSVNSVNWLTGIHNFHRQHKACRCFRGPEVPVTRQCYSERYLCVPHHLSWGTSTRQHWCWCFWRLKYSFIQSVETVATIFLAFLLSCRLPSIITLLFLSYHFVSLLSACVDVWCMFLPFIMIALNAFHYGSDRLNYRRHASFVFRHSSQSLRPHLNTESTRHWVVLTVDKWCCAFCSTSVRGFPFQAYFLFTSCLFIGWLYALLSVLVFFFNLAYFFALKLLLERTWGKHFTFSPASVFRG